MDQSVAGISNTLSLKNTLYVSAASSISLGGTAGKVVLHLDVDFTNTYSYSGNTYGRALRTMTTTTPVIINNNGALVLGSAYNGSTILSSIIEGDVYINGGELNVEKIKNTTSATQTNSNANRITGDLTMASGTITFGTEPITTGITSTTAEGRIYVNGQINLTGGSINVAGEPGALIADKDVTINDVTISTERNFTIHLQSSGTQTVTSNVALGDLVVRNSGNKIVNLSYTGASGNLKSIQFLAGGTDGTVTMTLANNITGKSGGTITAATYSVGAGSTSIAGTNGTTYQAAATISTTASLATGSVVNYILDTASYTLDYYTNNTGYTFSPGNSIGSVSGVNSYVPVNWIVQGDGSFIAAAFDFTKAGAIAGSATYGSVSVAGNVKLIAKGGNSTTSNLGTFTYGGYTIGGTIASTSTFVYAGNAAYATPHSLLSNRTIGGLEVDSGYLNVSQTSLSTGGSVSLIGGGLLLNGSGAGAINIAAGQNYTQSNGTLYITLGTASDQIIGSGGTFTISGGTLSIEQGAGFSYYSTYTVFSGFSSGSISNLTITGYDNVNFTASLGTNGVLAFAAIPEPSTVLLFASALLLLVPIALKRRHTKLA